MGRVGPVCRGRIQWTPHPVSNPEEYEEKRKEFGVDVVVYSPGQFKLTQIPNAEKRVHYMWALNEYLVERFADPENQNFAKLLAIPEHPKESARIIEEYGDEPGVAGIFMIDVGPQYPLGHQQYEPMYEAAENQDLPIFLHSGSGLYPAFPTRDLNVETFMEYHTLTHPMAKMWHATSIIARGIPERYDIDWCFLEAGVSWIQFLRTRMDREYIERPSDAPEMNKLPSEYLSDFYYGLQPLEEQPRKPEDLQTIIEMNDLEDQLVLATDYPHMDFDAPASVFDHEGLTTEQKRKIAQDNPRELLNL
ncbi:amidohydrolase family protein [Halorussus caseinilyticus]|uniref:Amidohydrolase family protein n=1 Tax=Halorussus caseinilyticus TaxID=3034025 RepID=A0ABD5WMT5_9EURY